MAYDEGVAQRIREVLDAQPEVVEKKMFGGVAFMVNGHMCVGVTGAELMARVGPEQYADAPVSAARAGNGLHGQGFERIRLCGRKGF